MAGSIGAFGVAYPSDQLVRAVGGEQVEQAGPVEEVVGGDRVGGAVGEQGSPAYPLGVAQRGSSGDGVGGGLRVGGDDPVAIWLVGAPLPLLGCSADLCRVFGAADGGPPGEVGGAYFGDGGKEPGVGVHLGPAGTV